MICELFSSLFYLFENMSDDIPISMSVVLKSEVFFEECSLQSRCASDEKHRIGDIVFLLKFLKELFCHDDNSRRKRPHMKEFVRSGIDSGVQPSVFIGKLNHSLINGDVIRLRLGSWL